MKDKIQKALKIMRKLKPGVRIELEEEPKPVKTGDHEPCIDCGNTEFIRTGTCFACVTCGASQGCS